MSFTLSLPGKNTIWEFDDRTDRQVARAFMDSSPASKILVEAVGLVVEQPAPDKFDLVGGSLSALSVVRWDNDLLRSHRNVTFSGPFHIGPIHAVDCQFLGGGRQADERMTIMSSWRRSTLIGCQLRNLWIMTPAMMWGNSSNAEVGHFTDCRLDRCSFYGENIAAAPLNKAKQALKTVLGNGSLQFHGQNRWAGYHQEWIEAVHSSTHGRRPIQLVEDHQPPMLMWGTSHLPLPAGTTEIGQLGQFLRLFGDEGDLP